MECLEHIVNAKMHELPNVGLPTLSSLESINVQIPAIEYLLNPNSGSIQRNRTINHVDEMVNVCVETILVFCNILCKLREHLSQLVQITTVHVKQHHEPCKVSLSKCE